MQRKRLVALSKLHYIITNKAVRENALSQLTVDFSNTGIKWNKETNSELNWGIKIVTKEPIFTTIVTKNVCLLNE